MRRVIAFVRLGRPLFLGGGFAMYGLGVAVAARSGHAIDLRRFILGQLAVTAFQLMTHYANEFYDVEADRANATPTRWSGGSRVLVAGELPVKAAFAGAIALAVLGGIATGVLASDAPPWTAPILAATWALAWEYSAPPFRLCAAGAGELATATVVTGLVPWLGFYLQAPDLTGARTLALAIVPLALLQFAMLLAIEFPDAAGDAATGKRTLVVRLGPTRAARLYVATTAAAYAWLPLAALLGLPGTVAAAMAIPLPVAVWRIARIAEHADARAHERLTFAAVFLLIATSLCALGAFVV